MENKQSAEPQTAGSPADPKLPPKSLLSWLLFLPYILVFLSSLLIADVLLRLASPFGERALGPVRDLFNTAMLKSLRLLGTRVSVRGQFPIDPEKAYILVSNHQSMFDIPLLYCTFMEARPRFISKKELAKWIPGVSINLRKDHSALIDRTNPRQALPEIKRLAKLAAEKKFGIVIFPEGTRARNGVMKSFRPSGIAMLLKHAPDAEVIPVAIDGSWKLQCYRYGPLPFGVHIRAQISEPLSREGKNSEEIVAELEARVREMLNELRQA